MARITPVNRIVLPAVTVAGQETQPTGLSFLENGTTGSDIRLNWKGANLPPRKSHSVIIDAYYIQQTGYYATLWHVADGDVWPANYWGFGCHPYPCDGNFDGPSGQATGSTFGSGTVHYYEIAGIFTGDYISSQSGSSSKQVVKGQWVRHFRKAEVISGTTVRHTFYPDIINDPTFFIQQDRTVSQVDGDDPGSDGAFIIGCSPWTSSNWFGSGSGYTNSECPYGHLRNIKVFDAPLSLADAQSEGASGSDSPVTSAGIASVWYMNQNPTPSDVSDKSGAGHSPSWANANRPTLWTG